MSKRARAFLEHGRFELRTSTTAGLASTYRHFHYMPAAYEPIYSYQSPSSAHIGGTQARSRSLFAIVAVLVFVSFASVVFLTTGESISLKYSFKTNTAPIDLSSDTGSGMRTTESLNEFLARTKKLALEHLGKTSNQHVTIIMGNEAGDLDSASSAIALSYMLTHLGSPAGVTLPTSTYIPLIQSNHDDAPLRPENTAAYHASKIEPQNLLCLDDLQKAGLELDSAAFSPDKNVAIGLVDHPSLTGPWGGAKAANRRVDIVVDHHEDVGDHADAKLRIIKSPSKELVGSASSLIAGLYKDQLGQDKIPTQVVDLLLSAILIDTDNLRSAPRGKATEVDFAAIKTLLPASSFASPESAGQIQQAAFVNSPLNLTKPSEPSTDPVPPASPTEGIDPFILDAKIIFRSYWETLSKSKLMVSHLSGRDLLRRDYKELDFTEPADADSGQAKLALRLGFASVPISIVEWLHKDRPVKSLLEATDAAAEVEAAWSSWWQTLDAFMAERKIDIAVMTGTFREPEGEKDAGKHNRELVLAFAPRNMPEERAVVLWKALRDGLEADAHVSRAQVERRLMLEQPWKGQRLPISAGGKRERVAGIDYEGRRSGPAGAARWAKVYKQANARANRKIVLPAVVTVLRMAAAKL